MPLVPQKLDTKTIKDHRSALEIDIETKPVIGEVNMSIR
jgi:hypothetical protein